MNITNEIAKNNELIIFISKIIELQKNKKLNIDHTEMYPHEIRNFEAYCLDVIKKLKELNSYYENFYFSKDEKFEDFAEKFVKLKQSNMELKEELELEKKKTLENYFKGKAEAKEELIENLMKGLGI